MSNPANAARQAARIAKEKTYDAGKPCVRGHISERSTATGICLRCGRENEIKCKANGPKEAARITAQKSGAEFYVAGRQCSKGHEDKWYVSTARCRSCVAERGVRDYSERIAIDQTLLQEHRQRATDWKKVNPAKIKLHNKKWRDRNPEKAKAQRRKWYQSNTAKSRSAGKAWTKANRVKVRANFKKWSDANRERVRALRNEWIRTHPDEIKLIRAAGRINRRTREAKNGGRCTTTDLLSVFAKCNSCCVVCGTTEEIEVDHVMPVTLGGPSDPVNLQLLCVLHNREKMTKHPAAWLADLAAAGVTPLLVFWPPKVNEG